MQHNLILATDSYKLSHAAAYPKDVVGMQSHIMPRVKNKTVVLFYLQRFIKKYLLNPITDKDVKEAQHFATLHGEPFDPKPWYIIIDEYDGYMPVTIKAVPEGMPVASGVPLVTIECRDPRLFWVVSYLETALLRAVWYPTTIASLDLEFKRDLVHLYRLAGVDVAGADFALHDFGGRGVTCSEQAEIGGGAHLLNFKGSDTIEGVRDVNFYYNAEMAGFSVPASEHSIETAYGDLGEEGYIRQMLDLYSKPGAIVSIVIDGYDVYRAAELLCTKFKQKIIDSKAKVVFRPDSGDMFEVIPRLLNMQAAAFGYTTTSKGYKVINNVGLLQGDGITRETGLKLLRHIMSLGYAPSCLVLGSGGGLLQQVNRDTYRFAQKANAILVAGKGWIGINKNPVTDAGKASPAGFLSTFKSLVTGEFSYVDTTKGVSTELVEVLRPVYVNGKLLVNETLETIRARLPV